MVTVSASEMNTTGQNHTQLAERSTDLNSDNLYPTLGYVLNFFNFCTGLIATGLNSFVVYVLLIKWVRSSKWPLITLVPVFFAQGSCRLHPFLFFVFLVSDIIVGSRCSFWGCTCCLGSQSASWSSVCVLWLCYLSNTHFMPTSVSNPFFTDIVHNAKMADCEGCSGGRRDI